MEEQLEEAERKTELTNKIVERVQQVSQNFTICRLTFDNSVLQRIVRPAS